MLLTITCETHDATDLGYLLHKHPGSLFEAEKWFGRITVFYPVADTDRCTVALLLHVDPIGLVRGRAGAGLDQYVNDRPYVASSLLSVAIAEAFGTAMNGRSKERQERVGEKMPLEACLAVVRCSGGADLIARLFVPLGYTVTLQRETLDVRFPEWGESDIYTLTLHGTQTVQDLLTHLYVLIPVLDNAKHYFVGADEVDKLLQKGGAWLAAHPEKELIARRYLRYRQAHVRDALDRIEPPHDDAAEAPQAEVDASQEAQEAQAEEPLRLNEARMKAAMDAVQELSPPARRVLDLGCGEGRLLKMLLAERGFDTVVGVDVAAATLERAAQRLRFDTLPPHQRARIQLIQGSLVYRDERFAGFDVALLIEVIEHLDPSRLPALEAVVLRHARPRRVIVTTPNREYNSVWPSLPADRFRHRDHRFEWTRAEFAAWAGGAAERNQYTVKFRGIGPEDPERGCPTQMAIFDRKGP